MSGSNGVPWAGDDPRWDQVRAAWESHANETIDDAGLIDLTEVDTCVSIALHKAFMLAASPEGDGGGWRDISTAPKDGTPVLAFWGNAGSPMYGVIFWDDGAWYEGQDAVGKMTHWCLLPQPPARGEGG